MRFAFARSAVIAAFPLLLVTLLAAVPGTSKADDAKTPHGKAYAKAPHGKTAAKHGDTKTADTKTADLPPVIYSAKSGPWSAAATWEGGKVPAAAARVLIKSGHVVTYDAASDDVIRAINIAGTLTFAADRDTRLNVGLIKIEAMSNFSEEGFDCDAHLETPDTAKPRATLSVGTPESPIPAKHSAVIRLHYVEGHDKQSCPAIVCCAGKMEMHGAPISHSWVKLGATASKGDTKITLSELVTGWRVGDKLILTATVGDHSSGGTFRPGKSNDAATEERTIKAIDGAAITLDAALKHDHTGTGHMRGEVANLSRNVVVESANPKGVRGHTMYHRHSAGSLAHAEFRHLGKEGVLGRYSIHYHEVGNTMRGSSVVGCSIWDSHNRWVTIHGTNYLVVRDNVGYQSVGHGFFMEDGTEVYNVLDRNLAVQSFHGKRLPKQVLPFDGNDGAGFWWANSLNTFTRNVAVENDRYGFRFEATPSSEFRIASPMVMLPNGELKPTDIRELPFVKFAGNESHSNGLYGINIGEGVQRRGPDSKHPFVMTDTLIWMEHYAFRPQSPNLLVERMRIEDCIYGVYHPNYDNHVYRDLKIFRTDAEPFNRGHDDESVQYGVLTVDGLEFDSKHIGGGMPFIQMSDDNPTGKAESHFRNVKSPVRPAKKGSKALVDLGGGSIVTPKTPHGVRYVMHDYYGPGRDAVVVSVKAKSLLADGNNYRQDPPLTGNDSLVAEVKGTPFPELLSPVDDLPPATVITGIAVQGDMLLVTGTVSDASAIRKVIVNGKPATLDASTGLWKIELPSDTGAVKITAHSEDAAGNVEKLPHEVVWK